HLAAALLRRGLVDRVAWFRAPSVIGGDGLPAVVAFGVGRLDEAPRFRRTGLERIGDDTVEWLARD
ncbi:MAG: dihydrofolate reductase family protein, partial [Alphaproteobacteria bacterium]|nr:dihydrofolate reductase family protein [Alphaproteobacteria bacterium]